MDGNDDIFEQAGNEAFNPERAAQMRGKIDQHFQNAQRRIDRRTYVNLFFAILAAWVAGYFFMTEAETTRGIVACGLIVLAALEHTILIKLWYWIANNKVSTLYELRMLRLDMMNPGQARGGNEFGGYSLKQRISWPWFAAILLVGIVGGGMVSYNAQFRGTMTSDRTVKIAADGKAAMETLYSLENTTDVVFQDYSLYSGGEISEVQYLSPEESPMTDDQGRGIPATVVPAGCNHRFDYHLNKPVMPRERFAVRSKDDWKADLKDGIWEFKMSQDFGYRHSYYRDTITLPQGANLISIEPVADCVVDKDGAKMVMFSGVRRNGARWAYSIKYQMP